MIRKCIHATVLATIVVVGSFMAAYAAMKIITITVNKAQADPLIFDDGIVTDMETSEQQIYTEDSDGNVWILTDDAPTTDPNDNDE